MSEPRTASTDPVRDVECGAETTDHRFFCVLPLGHGDHSDFRPFLALTQPGTEALRALHEMIGYEGEGIGVWVHRPGSDGSPKQRSRFLTFEVADVHDAIDKWAALSTVSPAAPTKSCRHSVEWRSPHANGGWQCLRCSHYEAAAPVLAATNPSQVSTSTTLLDELWDDFVAAWNSLDGGRIRQARKAIEAAAVTAAPALDAARVLDNFLENELTFGTDPESGRSYIEVGARNRLDDLGDALHAALSTVSPAAPTPAREFARQALAEALERRSRAYHVAVHRKVASWDDCPLSECVWDRAALRGEK